jgi:hypothetical protein
MAAADAAATAASPALGGMALLFAAGWVCMFAAEPAASPGLVLAADPAAYLGSIFAADPAPLFAPAWSTLLDMAAAVCKGWPVTGSLIPAPQAVRRTAALQQSNALARIVEANVSNFFI